METDSGQLGGATLKLLADDWASTVIRELIEGPRRPGELERRLDGLTHAGLMRNLGRLSLEGIVAHRRLPGSPPRAQYALTKPGHALLDVTAAAVRWERRSRVLDPLWDESNPSPGALALRIAADERTRAIMRELAGEPLRPAELERRLTGVAHATVARQLKRLTHRGILTRSEDGRVSTRYELTAQARRLGLLPMLAARWEWRWRSTDGPTPPGDLTGLMRLLAPLARVPASVAGLCRVRMDSHTVRERDVDFAVDRERVVALPELAAEQPGTQAHATPEVWCNVLLAGHPAGLAVDGDGDLLAITIGALSDALLS